MLINDFYSCDEVKNSDTSLQCRVVFNGGHAIFAGHFPGQPVVPGVCMMEIVKELLQMQLREKLILKNAPNVKFLQLITPEIQPLVNIAWEKKDKGYAVIASFHVNGAPSFKLNGNYEIVLNEF